MNASDESNENIDPRSLPNISNSTHKRNHNKYKAHTRTSGVPESGLKASILGNLTTSGREVLTDSFAAQLPTPPNSQSVDPNLVEATRLPISPPPEEEIRIKKPITHGNTPKQPQSRLPVPSRAAPSGIFKFPGAPLSSTNRQQQACASPSDTTSGTDPDPSNPNPRKRTRSTLPPIVPPLPSAPPGPTVSSTPAAESLTIDQSPNPKSRKHPKVHDSGIYGGSGFKRRHQRGTSAESLDAVDGEKVALVPPQTSFKSPARKKRTHDPGVQDYTPQREQGSTTKRKARARRSVTPDVRYEPPTEQFTPPRKVVLHVPSSTTSTRSRKPKPASSAQSQSSVERTVVRVKPERLTSPFPLPPVDLSKPVPPPSPTDDPLLLVGSPVLVRRSATPSESSISTIPNAVVGVNDSISGRRREISTPVRASPRRDVDESRWDIGVTEETALMDVAFDGPSTFDATFEPDSDSDSNDGGPVEGDSVVFDDPVALPMASVFDPDQSTGSHIFHSDDEAAEAGEDEGEFTGRFTYYNVPVAHDPPSSATRVRRDCWGRPVSPFPFQRRLGRPPLEEDPPANAMQLVEDSPPPSPSIGRRRPGTSTQTSRAASPLKGTCQADLRTSGFTLSEMEARLETRLATREVRDVSPEVDSDADIDETESEQDRDTTINVENREAARLGDDEEGDDDLEVAPMHENPGCDKDDGQAYEAEDGENSGRKFDIQLQEESFDSQDEENEDNEHDLPRALSPGTPSQATLTTSTSTHKTGQHIEHYVPLRDEDEDNLALQNTYGDDDSSSDEGEPTVGVVEISSGDPKAAARAAAILKLHHSYILDGVVAKRTRRSSSHPFARRSSFAFGDKDSLESQANEDIIRRAQRKSIADSGGVLQHRQRHMSHSPLARSTFVTPGSPAVSTISAEEALREAETAIRAVSASPRGPRTPLSFRSFGTNPQFVTPSPAAVQTHQPEDSGQTQDTTEWTKAHWKRLDTCFTDERLAVGNATGLGAQMAEVDDVEIETVVDRFLEETPEAKHWDRNMLLRRATALSTRQRAGQGAPPSPVRFASGRPRPELAVPFAPPPVLDRVKPPSDIGASKRLPPSLLAPRYAHLHEEVAVIASEQSLPLSKSNSKTPAEEISQPRETDTEPNRLPEQPSTPQLSRPAPPSHRDGRTAPAPALTTKRVLSYFGSLLGRGGTSVTSKPFLKPVFNALPLPPPEMRQVARGQVTTPAKKPIPKSQPPRELVHLAETQPSKPCPPLKARSARELVNLNHIEPPRSVQKPRTASVPIAIPGRTRKDSGGSVKDLVKSFEDVRRRTEEEMMRSKGKTAMRKVASVGDLKSWTPWRP